MFELRKNLSITVIYFAVVLSLLFSFLQLINREYSESSNTYKVRKIFLQKIHIASVATITGGRNVAFETGNALSNAPASYLTMLDCCESDEAISDRIAVGQTSCRIIKGR